MRLYRRTVYQLEKEALPDYAHFDSRESLKNAKCKAMIIHSMDDKTCSFRQHFGRLLDALKNEERITFLEVDKKNHHPQYTEDAVKYKSEFGKALKAKLKRNELNTDEEKAAFVASYDFHRMHQQDEALWDKIIEFLEK